MKRDDYVDNGNLLSALLQEEFFQDDDKMIIDECITFFFAGTQTTSITVTNTLMYLMKNP